ncbi:MAG: cupin domain-containing protein [Pseudomonadota bacterium]
MALHHAASGELINIAPLGAKLGDAKTAALFKSAHLEVIQMVLPAGKLVRPHQVPGEITLQCLEGRLELDIPGAMRSLSAGQLVCLAGGVPHAMTAMEDTALLMTILLQPAT